MAEAEVQNPDSHEMRCGITAKLREYVNMRKTLCANCTTR